jgi:hypothetical protein
MRLFEVDAGGARQVLAVLQGLANKPGKEQAGELPWHTVKGFLDRFALGISTPDGLIALKNQIDPNGDVIQDVKDDGTLVLNTQFQNPNDEPQLDVPKGGPTVDKMASRNAKSAIK